VGRGPIERSRRSHVLNVIAAPANVKAAAARVHGVASARVSVRKSLPGLWKAALRVQEEENNESETRRR